MPNSNIPKRFPTNLAMLHLTPEEIEQFRDVSLADMAIELRRRIAAINQPTCDGINLQKYSTYGILGSIR